MRTVLLILCLVLTTATTSSQSVLPETSGQAVRYGSSTEYTANGELYTPSRMTAAHATLPFGTLVQVTHGTRTISVRINDRNTGGGIIRLSDRAADQLGLSAAGGEISLRLDSSELAYLEARARRDREAQQAAEQAALAAAEQMEADNTPTVGGADIFTVQLGAFHESDAAYARVADMRGAWIDRVTDANGRTLYRVCYGRYGSASSAARARDDLRETGIDGFVQRVNQQNMASGN